MKNRFIKTFEFKLGRSQKERFTQPSITVPDEAMNLKQILARMRRGETLPITRNGYMSDSDDFDSPDFEEMDRMDIVDKSSLVEDHIELLNDVNEKLTKKQQEAERSKAMKKAKHEAVELEEVSLDEDEALDTP